MAVGSSPDWFSGIAQCGDDDRQRGYRKTNTRARYDDLDGDDVHGSGPPVVTRTRFKVSYSLFLAVTVG